MKCDAFERAGPRRIKVDIGLLGGAQEQEKSNLVMGIVKCVEVSIYSRLRGSGLHSSRGGARLRKVPSTVIN